MEGFGILSVIGWVILIGLVAYVLFIASRRAQGQAARYSITLIVGGLLVGLGLNVVGNGLVFVQPQERGVVISALSPTGYRGPALSPGLHLIIPVLENVKRYSVAQQAYTMSKTPTEGQVSGDDSVTARTQDGQLVYIDATVQYQVDEGSVIDLYVKWQDRYTNDFVRPQSRAIVYNRTASYKVEEVYSTKREELSAKITDELSKVFQANGLKLTAFLLRNVTFSDEYAQSIEQKQIAQQNAERAKFLVQQQQQEAERVRVEAKGLADATITKASGDAESQVIRAKAEAQSLLLVSDALKDNPSLLTFRYIEKIAPTIHTMLLPSSQPLMLDVRSLLPQAPTPPVSTSVPVTP